MSPLAPAAPMSADHLDHVAAIELVTAPWPWSRQLLEEELRRDDRCYLVVRGEDGRPAGFGGIALLAGEAHVMRLAVDPSARRRGHGERLLRGLLAVAAARGSTGVTLEVRASNDVALRLYRRVGFDVAGVRPGYYADGEDAMILWWRPEAAATGVVASGGRHDAVPTGG